LLLFSLIITVIITVIILSIVAYYCLLLFEQNQYLWGATSVPSALVARRGRWSMALGYVQLYASIAGLLDNTVKSNR
jgi:hypothetical protein